MLLPRAAPSTTLRFLCLGRAPHLEDLLTERQQGSRQRCSACPRVRQAWGRLLHPREQDGEVPFHPLQSDSSKGWGLSVVLTSWFQGGPWSSWPGSVLCGCTPLDTCHPSGNCLSQLSLCGVESPGPGSGMLAALQVWKQKWQKKGEAFGGGSRGLDKSADTCFRCGGTGHWASECRGRGEVLCPQPAGYWTCSRKRTARDQVQKTSLVTLHGGRVRGCLERGGAGVVPSAKRFCCPGLPHFLVRQDESQSRAAQPRP